MHNFAILFIGTGALIYFCGAFFVPAWRTGSTLNPTAHGCLMAAFFGTQIWDGFANVSTASSVELFGLFAFTLGILGCARIIVAHRVAVKLAEKPALAEPVLEVPGSAV